MSLFFRGGGCTTRPTSSKSTRFRHNVAVHIFRHTNFEEDSNDIGGFHS